MIPRLPTRPSILAFSYAPTKILPRMINKLAISPDWQTADLSNIPALVDGEVHLWCLPLSLNEHQSQQALSWLSDIQRDKYVRRRKPQAQMSYLAGRYYLLSLLGAYSGCRPDQVLLSYTRLNKPYLSDPSAHLHFNFTDTTGVDGTYGLFAFSRAGELGVDIESFSRRNSFNAIASSRFTAAEQALVMDDNGNVDPKLFLCVWTRKEASGKATGQGINFVMNQRDLVLDDHAELNYFDEQQQPWRLTQLRLTSDLIGCVVHSGHQKLAIKTFNRLQETPAH